jgi:hypothetical protein
MRKDDARQLDHATLEAMRERAVRSMQSSESPEVVDRVIGVNRSAVYGWLAQSTWRLGSVESQTAVRASAKT